MRFAAVFLLILLALAAPAGAQIAGQQPLEIPQSPLGAGVDPFEGASCAPGPARGLRVPQHPFMAPDPGSNIHNDAYQSDTYDRSGPLGDDIAPRSALFVRECASVTFDSQGRIVTVCVGLDRPVLTVLDPRSPPPVLGPAAAAAPDRHGQSLHRTSPAAATSTSTIATARWCPRPSGRSRSSGSTPAGGLEPQRDST